MAAAGPVPLINSRDKWVMFSDLHLKAKNSDVGLKVLGFVHEEAQARGAGVIFLGDFWDTANTGYLNVGLLNEVVEFFRLQWKVPLLMIPGNHDMVRELLPGTQGLALGEIQKTRFLFLFL